jgi:putative ABC transport system permease protein
VAGRPPAPGEPPPSAHVRLVSDGYLDALAVPLVRGRLLEPGDMRPGAPPVVVVNERLASLLWAADEPLGQRVSGWTAGPEPEWREVVGVVADVRTFGPDESVEPEIFVPYTQAPSRSWDAFERSLALVIRVSGDTGAYAGVLRQAVRTVDPTLPLFDVQTLDEMLAASTAPERFRMRLFGAIAAVAILLAAVGVYGVVAYAVTRRTREIGIRMALGAGRIEVMGMVVRQALVMTLVGIAVGLAGAAWVTRYLEALLFDVTPLDAVTFVGVAVVFTLVAAVAAYLPAHRAARVNPIVALRAE